MTSKANAPKQQAQNHAHLLSLASKWLGHSKQTTLFSESSKNSKKQKKQAIA